VADTAVVDQRTADARRDEHEQSDIDVLVRFAEPG
jgi:predicted nucleotidyltransferase